MSIRVSIPVRYGNGDKAWLGEGKWHRVGGPAWEGNEGSISWYFNGKCHRTDGAALTVPGGSSYYLLSFEVKKNSTILIIS